MVVAAAMLLLPILYVGLIGLTGYAVWWHATQNVGIVGESTSQWRVLLYLAPIIVGVVLTFFMIKPILARPAAGPDPQPLDQKDEPVLFAFIEEICRQVGARRPGRVQVDCAVNASASFVGRRFQPLRRDLVLTIGLPLVAGLSSRQLAGVLAHEFGHFAQGGGMRLTAIVRGVNAWFGRVVYERDQWDETLERWSTKADWRLAIVLGIARLAVWVSRQVLNGLMWGGHAISCFMLRQMEYDADSYEIKIAGSDTFIRTMARLRELDAAAHFAYGDVRAGLTRGKVPADMPTYLVERSRHLPPDVLAQFDRTPEETKIFDTHPSDADRVRAAEVAAARGVLIGGDDPALRLFRNFEALSAAVTRWHFESDLGLDVDGLALVDTTAALTESRQRAEHFNAIETFFGDRFTSYRPLRVTVDHLQSLSRRELQAEWAAAASAMAATGQEVTRGYEEFDRLEVKRQQAFAAGELFAAGFQSVRTADFDLAEGTATAAASEERTAIERQNALASTLEPFETKAACRLSCGVAFIRQSGSGGGHHDATAVVDALNALGSVIADVWDLRRLDIASDIVEANVSSSPTPEHAAAHHQTMDRRVAACRERIRKALASVPCPAAFTAVPMTLAERCGMPPDGPLASASEVVDRVLRLYLELLGCVAAAVLHEESNLSV